MVATFLHEQATKDSAKNSGIKNEIVSKSYIRTYPNSTEGVLHVVCEEKQTIQKVTVTDSVGRIVISQNASCNSTDIDMSHLQKGIYFVDIKTNERRRTERVVLR